MLPVYYIHLLRILVCSKTPIFFIIVLWLYTRNKKKKFTGKTKSISVLQRLWNVSPAARRFKVKAAAPFCLFICSFSTSSSLIRFSTVHSLIAAKSITDYCIHLTALWYSALWTVTDKFNQLRSISYAIILMFESCNDVIVICGGS